MSNFHEPWERPRIYVAGPMTTKNPLGPYAPVGNAARIGTALYRAGWLPFIPHLNALWEMVSGELVPGHPEAGGWLDYDFGWVKQCNALYRMDGPSEGADKEVDFATRNGLPILRGHGPLDCDGSGAAWNYWSAERRAQYGALDGCYVGVEPVGSIHARLLSTSVPPRGPTDRPLPSAAAACDPWGGRAPYEVGSGRDGG